jgi:hypothetical protein
MLVKRRLENQTMNLKGYNTIDLRDLRHQEGRHGDQQRKHEQIHIAIEEDRGDLIDLGVYQARLEHHSN